MARGISTRLLAGGNDVTLAARNTTRAAELAKELRAVAKGGATVAVVPFDGPITGDIVILAVPYSSVPSIVQQYGDKLAGKIVVDITNPLNTTYDDLATLPGSSAAEETARMVPAGAKVVKAFNTVFAGTLTTGQVADQPLNVFIAGDDAEPKTLLANLIRAGGMRPIPINVGPLRRARHLESVGLLHITSQGTLGTNWMSAVKILS
jgi:predicted dinucleotide-binding enzyme